MDDSVISALAATNSQHVLGKILVRLLTMRTIQELKQGEYSVTSGKRQNNALYVPNILTGFAGGGKAIMKGARAMSECTREFTEEEISAEHNAKLAKENENLRMQIESLREVIAWLNIKMLNQEKDRRW